MSIGDRRRSSGPLIFPSGHHPLAPTVGDVPSFALANAYGLATTGSRFLAQWWRPVPAPGTRYPAPYAAGAGGPLVDAQLFTGSYYVPEHWDLLRIHLVWALVSTYGLDVTHRALVDSLPSESIVDAVSGDDGEWGTDVLLLDGWPRLYETSIAAEIPTPGQDVALDVRLSLSGDSGLGIALYWPVGVTVFGEVT